MTDPELAQQFPAAVLQAITELAFFEGFFSRNGDEEEMAHRATLARTNLQSAYLALTNQSSG